MIKDMNTKEGEKEDFVAGVLMGALARKVKQADRLVLSDDLIRKAVNGEAKLSVSQYKALLCSPLTLRRAAFLIRGVHAAGVDTTEHKQTVEDAIFNKFGDLRAANDADFWAGSRFLRIAADSGVGERSEHLSDNGCWRLIFERLGESGWLVSLTLVDTETAPESLLAGHLTIQLIDGTGKTWFSGTLDPEADGGPSLEHVWKNDVAPEAYFRDQGGRFEVRPC